MDRKVRLRELIPEAKSGNQGAMIEVIRRFIPIIKKHSRRWGYTDYEDMCADLTAWVIGAVHR